MARAGSPVAEKPTTRGVVDAAALAAAQLDELGARFALIGGLAVGARAEPRYPRDVDLAVATADYHRGRALLTRLRRWKASSARLA